MATYLLVAVFILQITLLEHMVVGFHVWHTAMRLLDSKTRVVADIACT
jgi:hypothetical protein